MSKLLLIGGGGHAKSVISLLKKNNDYDEIAIIDSKNIEVLGIKTIGEDKDLPELFKDGYEYAFITVGSIGDSSLRKNLFDIIVEIGFKIPNIISKSAIVETDSIGIGNFIGNGVIINAGVELQDNNIINTGAILDHDVKVGSHVHIGPGATLSGGVSIANEAHVGVNSTIIQGLSIGEKTIIGAGTVVIRDIPDKLKVAGNPAREI